MARKTLNLYSLLQEMIPFLIKVPNGWTCFCIVSLSCVCWPSSNEKVDDNKAKVKPTRTLMGYFTTLKLIMQDKSFRERYWYQHKQNTVGFTMKRFFYVLILSQKNYCWEKCTLRKLISIMNGSSLRTHLWSAIKMFCSLASTAPHIKLANKWPKIGVVVYCLNLKYPGHMKYSAMTD